MSFKKVTAKEWEDMGLPLETNTIHFGNSKLLQELKKRKEGEELSKKLKNFVELSYKLNQEYNIKYKIKPSDNKQTREYRIDPVTGKQVLKTE